MIIHSLPSVKGKIIVSKGHSEYARAEMEDALNLAALGERLRKVRLDQRKTLKRVSEETGISVTTLSRVERGAAREIGSNTLLALAKWLDVSLDLFNVSGPLTKPGQSTPDIIELQLRGDKNLDGNLAAILAKMFRAAYEQATKTTKKK